MSQPWARWEWVNSQKSRDLPTPGSPETATICPCPAAARAIAWCSDSTSGSRPTNGVSPRAALASRRERTCSVRSSSKISTGSGIPFTGTGPSGLTSM